MSTPTHPLKLIHPLRMRLVTPNEKLPLSYQSFCSKRSQAIDLTLYEIDNLYIRQEVKEEEKKKKKKTTIEILKWVVKNWINCTTFLQTFNLVSL